MSWQPCEPLGARSKTRINVDTQNWSPSAAQSGSTLYVKQIPLNHVHDIDSITVSVGGTNTTLLPTLNQQKLYNLLQYAAVDDSVPCLYLYSSAIPTSDYYIDVTNVD